MKIKIFRIASFTLLALAFRITATNAQQHLVLFETVTNNCDPTGLTAYGNRNAFDASVNAVVASEASKIIHLDLHILNECDWLQVPSTAAAATHILPPGNEIFWSAVDRTLYSNGTRGSTAESDWTDAINSEYSKSAPASMQLLDATLDTNSQTYHLHADVNVIFNSDISDSLIIRYAIVQDQCKDTLNNTSTILNDVVRQITNSNTGAFLVSPTGGTAGTQKKMTWDVSLQGPTFPSEVKWDYTKIRLVAFLESTHDGDFQVVNAAVLRQDLDTLQAPPPTLSIVSSGLDSTVLNPGSTKQIFYNETNLANGVDAYYSLNNGATWNLIADSLPNQFNWTVPDSLTTQGKIKLVAVGFPNLISIDSGTFTIANPPSIAFVPASGHVLMAATKDTVRWTKYGVGGVLLQYAFANQSGGFSAWNKIGDNITDTFATWTVPDTNIIIQLQLVPDKKEAPAASVTDTILKFVNSVSSSSIAAGLTITDVFPNPAASGEEMVLRYTESQPKPISVQVLDLLGRRMIEHYQVDNQAIHLDTHSLAPGAYIVRVTDGVNVVSRRMEIAR